MTYQRNQQNVAIANVSRRGMLKSVAGAGVFVLAAQFPAVRSAMAYASGADMMPHNVVTNPHVFVSIGRGRHRHHRGAPRRDGKWRRAHLAADDRRRRTRRRLVARARRPISGR